jgi:hypothetical protein
MGSTTTVRSEALVSEHEGKNRPRKDEIRTQLARLLASPLFHHSKHYPGLLRYVVNESLEGRGGHLKERALGVEVFGRDADYDTNADPVVRTSACEVRKRIAQYYHEPGHEDEIRIDLPAGSYVPEFRFPAVRVLPVAVENPAAVASLAQSLWTSSQRHWIPLAAALCMLVMAVSAVELRGSPSPVESFWGPVWGPADSVLVGIGGAAPNLAGEGEAGPTFREVMRDDNMAFSDALTMARLSGVAHEYGKKKLDVRRASVFTLTDLRKSPVILIGAFNNSWTMRLDQDLRFTYQWNAETHTGMIRDRQNPANRSWVHDPAIPYSSLTKDYAVVSRFMNPLTEKMVVVVGGMGRDATIAAGEFVTDPRYLAMLAERAPRHWEKKNVQVLLATDIVKGTTGPPRILATYFW